MSDQAHQILAEALTSYQARNLYTEQQVAQMVELLKKGELALKSQLFKYSEIASLTPGQTVFQSRLKGLTDEVTRTLSQIQKDQTLLMTTATRTGFQSGITNGIRELKNAKFPRWEILNPEDQQRLAKQVMSVIDRNALDFMVRFNIQLVGNVHKELLNGIKQGLTLGIIKGDSIPIISQGLGSILTDPETFRRAGKTVFKTAQQRLELITRTEILRAHNQGRLKFFDTINVQRVQWMAVGDERTCPICGSLDGTEYRIDNVPPIPAHPACRCTTVAARAMVCPNTLEKYGEKLGSVSITLSAVAANTDVDCILIPQQLEELVKTAKQEKSQVNQIIKTGNYQLLNGKTLQKLVQQRGIAVTRSKLEFIKLLKPLEPDLDLESLTTTSLKALLKKHHISVLRSKEDLINLLKAWDQAHQVQLPDYAGWSIIKLREEAKKSGISVMRTKDDFIKMLDVIEPGMDHTSLKGGELSQKLSQYNIGKVRTKEELIGLLTGKAKLGQVVKKTEDLVKKHLIETAKKAKAELETLIEALKPHEVIADPGGFDSFLKSYIKGYEILAKNNSGFLPEDMSAYIARLDSRFAVWKEHIKTLSAAQLKTIAKQAKLAKWQWMNKDEMITLLTAKDATSKEAVKKTVFQKWQKWKLNQTGKNGKPGLAKPYSAEVKELSWKKVDTAWDDYKKTEPFSFTGQADIDGAHTKYFFQDQNGDRWLFKPVSESFRADGDEVAYRIGRLIDDQAVDVRVVRLNVPGRGPLTGSIQKWKSGLKGEFDFRDVPVTQLTAGDLEQLKREQVIDWLIGNHDSHPKQFIRHSDGRVFGIDKGQLYKFMGKDKLDIDYWPNRPYGEKEPIYNTIFRAFQNHELELDLNGTYKALRQVEKIPDAEFLSILRPYAEGRFGKDSANLKAFYTQALHRKNHIREDFEAFYSKLLTQRNGKKTVFHFEEVKPAGTVELTPEAEKIIEDAVAAGWQGKSLSLDGDDIEDLNGLVYIEKIKGTKKHQVNLRLKIRPESEKKILSLLDDTSESLTEIKGMLLKEDTFFNGILQGIKTLNHHIKDGDFNYNQETLKLIRGYQTQLTLLKKATDPDVVKMADTYLKAVHQILDGVKNNTKYPGRFSQVIRKTDKRPRVKKDTLPFKRQNVVYEHKINKNGEIVIDKTKGDDLKKVLRRDHAKGGEEYRIDLSDGVEAVYKPWSDKNYYAHQGELELKITGTPDNNTIGKLIDKLNDLGLDGRLALAEDEELVYLTQQAYLIKEDLTPGYQTLLKTLDKQKATREQRINALRGYWANKLGVEDITDLSEYNPRGVYALSGNGIRKKAFNKTAGFKQSYRFDVSQKELEKTLKGYGLFHNVTNGRDMITTIDTILSNNGAMASTVEKIRLGLPVGGMSPLDDMNSGGASYFFTRLRKLPGSHAPGEVGLYFKKDLIRRLDSITYDSDKFGRVTGTSVRQNRHYDVQSYKRIADRTTNDETIFKNSVTLLDNLDCVNVYTTGDKIRLLDVFQKHGITKLPDGRKIEDVIYVMGKS